MRCSACRSCALGCIVQAGWLALTGWSAGEVSEGGIVHGMSGVLILAVCRHKNEAVRQGA